ncbi:hypothetical protein CC85DRAFT_239767 [Cutaneotrichosporon oleaginosum]|uniref:Uncharacterized protein n=1 Tax=Cutaneotrichosporon oleaginosum TaxID=879819 RepID=A0A0J0XY59_9TREE|nr:uncharacterized protein CC85DRAFT_239767 [Cutaneotrichosporon oleaginosum]KLT45980.1 hypothetical protein CC85DRAFT_239767 [Cutaneotrichosporon oleaginosum]TXT06674.1 hypothetical protein COLE_06005 [Cutaneotrichosporon oleaginosum]
MLDAAVPEPPPSYADVEAESSAGGPSSGGESWPASLTPLFTGPPNAEPLISHDRAAALPEVVTTKMYNRYETADARLQSPNLLYDFIRAEALKAPTVKVRAAAFHWETSQRTQQVVERGIPRQVQAGQRYRVADFDFTIDLSKVVAHESNSANISLFTLPTTIPARRGTMGRTFGASIAPFPGAKSVGRSPTREEKGRWDAYAKFRHERGRAPWSDIANDEEFWTGYNRDGRGIALGGREDEEALISSQPAENDTALRAWCEAYTADSGPMKCFKLTKTVYGWDIAALRKAIMGAIHSTGYIAEDEQSITVDITVSEGDVVVRPPNFFSKYYYGSGAAHVFLMMLFWWAVPFLWLWQRLDPRAGGPYDVAVAAYGMKVYPPLPNTFKNESTEQAQHRLAALFKTHPEIPANPRLQRGPEGVHYLLGEREGQWFREWEERIRMAVRMRHCGELENPRVIDDGMEGPELDGYVE